MFDRKDKSYDKDSLQTPQYLFDWLNDIYEFDVDVAASHKHHLCDRYITKEQDALSGGAWCKDYGIAFCNPPYSKGMIDSFLSEAMAQYQVFKIRTVFAIPDFNGEKRSMTIMDNANRIITFNRRVAFIHPLTGKPQTNNNRGTMIVEIGGSKYCRHNCYDLKTIINNYSK